MDKTTPKKIEIIHRPSKDHQDKINRQALHKIADGLKEYSDLMHELANDERLRPDDIMHHLERILGDVQDQLGFARREKFRQ